MSFSKNFDEIIVAFNKAEVNYMVVGGYAVNYHGYERNTSDLDIWVKSSAENLNKICLALISLGYEEPAAKQILSFDINKAFLFHIGEKPADVEIFNSISGVKYEEAELHKISYSYPSGLPIFFIGLKELIVNKMLSGRLQDQADVEKLQKINQLKK